MSDDNKVFREYTQAELDAQYDQATLVPDISEYHSQWQELSSEAHKLFKVQADLAYGEGARERLDYFEAREPGSPLAVFYHGGAWTRHAKELFGYPALSLIPNGFAFASVEFDLVPQVRLETQVAQAQAAFAWLVNNAERLGHDPTRIFVMGHSSGAHLAAMVITTDWKAKLGRPTPVAGGVLASGLYDLEPVQLSARNSYLDLTTKQAWTLSPVHRLPSAPCPLVVAWGEAELDEFRRQSRSLATAWRRKDGACNAFELPGANHFDMSLEFCDAEGPLIRALHAVLDEARGDQEPAQTRAG